MTVTLDLDSILENLMDKLGEKIYFIIISSENGVVIKSYINEDEFNKSAISLNISQVYESSEEITDSIGIHKPDFTLIHSDNFYILSMKLLDNIFILLMEDQVDLGLVFQIINSCIIPS
ncbi:MAG: hypothetical protein ACQERB_15645 [Promethearchaeati archaeon]